MTAQRVKSKLETVEMKLKLSSVPRLPTPMQNNAKPVVKSNFPLFDNRMTFLVLFDLGYSLCDVFSLLSLSHSASTPHIREII